MSKDSAMPFDCIYLVYEDRAMPRVVRSCRIEKRHAALLARQAARRHLEVSTLASLYLEEKALEEEFPGIAFRDSAGGREAYLAGHRVAIWEVLDVFNDAHTVKKCADHFSWHPSLVRCALAFAREFPERIAQERAAEVAA
jgi:hypothetical protein